MTVQEQAGVQAFIASTRRSEAVHPLERLGGVGRAVIRNRFLNVIISLGVFIAVWQLVSGTGMVNPKLIPPPSVVFPRMITLTQDGELPADILASLQRVVVGLALGVLLGLVIGMLVGRITFFDLLVDPLLQYFRNLSPTAMIPIAIIWFGIGEGSKYFLVTWGTLFLVAINTTAGVRATPESRLRAAACMGVGKIKMFWIVVLPSAVPFIYSGVRLSVSSAFLSLIPAEMLAANKGIGYLLQESSVMGNSADIFVALFVIATLGFLFDWVVRLLWTKFLGRFETNA